jgi:hypothetical protein
MARRVVSYLTHSRSSRIPSCSATDILCSVKADLVHPSSSRPDAVVCGLSVDLSLCGDVLLGSSTGGGGSGGSGGGSAASDVDDRMNRNYHHY